MKIFISKQSNRKENSKKKKYRKPIAFLLLIVIVLCSIWFLTTIQRYTEFRRLQNKISKTFLTDLTVIPDTINIVSKMPDFTSIEWSKFSSEVDSEGIVVWDYDTLSIRGVSGKHKCLAGITSFAQRQFNTYLKTRRYENMLLGLRQIDYLVKEFKTIVINNEEVGLWEVKFDLGYQYKVKAPWHSCLYQANCLLVMLNAYQILHDPKYLDIFKKGLRAFKYDVKEGGLSYRTPNGGLFFQEVASIPYHHILNGHMLALILINKFLRASDSKEIKDIFNLGLQGLLEMLPSFDKYDYSLYSLSPNPRLINHYNIASPTYHYVHIAQLRALTDITNDKVLRAYAEKWSSETNSYFEPLWFSVYSMFKDAIYATKFIKRTIRI